MVKVRVRVRERKGRGVGWVEVVGVMVGWFGGGRVVLEDGVGVWRD